MNDITKMLELYNETWRLMDDAIVSLRAAQRCNGRLGVLLTVCHSQEKTEREQPEETGSNV